MVITCVGLRGSPYAPAPSQGPVYVISQNINIFKKSTISYKTTPFIHFVHGIWNPCRIEADFTFFSSHLRSSLDALNFLFYIFPCPLDTLYTKPLPFSIAHTTYEYNHSLHRMLRLGTQRNLVPVTFSFLFVIIQYLT